MRSRQPLSKHRSKSGHDVVSERLQETKGSHLYAEPDRKREGHDDDEQGCEDKKPLTGP